MSKRRKANAVDRMEIFQNGRTPLPRRYSSCPGIVVEIRGRRACRLEPYSSVGIHRADAITCAIGTRHQMSLPKTGSLLELSRGSIIACSSLWGACGAAIAEAPQAPANYRELIHSAVKTSFTDPSSVGLVEISPLHPTRGPQLGDWMACVRIAIHGQPTLYAAFIDGEPPKVALLRLAVRFDDCAQDQYEPLPVAPPAQDRPASPSRRK